MTREYRLLIGGDRVEGGGGTYEIVDPSTEEVIAQAPQASAAQAADAVAAARGAFDTWSATRPEERAELLDRVADLIERDRDELIELTIAETGGTRRTCTNIQVPHAAHRFRRYARGALEPTVTPLPPSIAEASALGPAAVTNALAQRVPVGVVSAITSYNFPLVNMAGKIGPALAAGNTVIVKPAPQDPLGVLRLVELCHEAGFPPGVVNAITTTDVAPAETLTTHADVDMVSFTGSTAVGQAIASAGGRTMKRLLLELGGKGACLVFDDADLGAATSGIASVWGFHSGQICTAPTRVLAQRGIYDQLVENLTAVPAFLTVGDPRDTATLVGPLISSAQRDRVLTHIQGGIDGGAELAAGGDRPDIAKGFYVNPTLFTGCTNAMAISREEIFGPVVVVIPFDDEDEAIAIANDSDYGLYDYVYTASTPRALRLAPRLRAGNVAVNTMGRNPETPFGGFKQSGIGRDGGSYGLAAYSELQSVIWPS
ncbi:aldehyde dehydrogenase family protein [Aquihabitans sp. McL0605]|uniref:aldehyde dehydrogenase family protein n=1 Tax=Aquihabitans sp. McL0605 TaxID=3415671 RepID=UPI003CF5FE98